LAFGARRSNIFAMPNAKLTITLPAGVWVGDVSRSHPETTLRGLAALPAEGTGVGLVEITAPDLPAVVADMETDDGVGGLEVLGAYENEAVVQFETGDALLLFSIRNSGVPLEPPVDIRDGTATLEVTASQERLSALGRQLEAFGLRFSVEYVRQTLESDPLLTDTQQTLLAAAVERGYYDTPRQCTLTQLAEAVGIAKSTASETLHRAEEQVVKQFVADRLDRHVDQSDLVGDGP